MKSSKLNFIFSLIIEIGIIMAVIIAAATKQQYSYYLFVRWLVTFSSIYLAYFYSSKKQVGFVIFLLGCALLFNPFKLFILQKETWHLIDYIIAAILFIAIIQQLIQYKKIT